jgi:PAS domain S-box-containing protein
MNLNKLFPRLTITAKLAIAFVMLALIPLSVLAALGTRSALSELRRSAESGLRHDMQLAHTRTERALREIEQHVSYVADVSGLQILGERPEVEPARRILAAYLTSDPSPLFRFKAIDWMGMRMLTVDARNSGEAVIEEPVPEPLYQWTASELAPDERAILPIEVRDLGDSTAVIPAVAVLVPVYDGEEYVGAIVGEARADALFEGLELASPGLEQASTALADDQGRFLFHSEYKRDWGSLLAGQTDVSLTSELPVEVVARLKADREGIFRLDDGRLLAFESIAVGRPGSRSFLLYRILPGGVLDRRVNSFLAAFGGLSVLLFGLVLAASAVAASQITRPVYALRNAARELAGGGSPSPMVVETNDELEDLAHDFNKMAAALVGHRRELEDLVEIRTTQLAQAEAHLGRIVTDATDAILALTPAGEITLWNRGAEELFGYAPHEVLGRPFHEVLPPPPSANGRQSSHGAPFADLSLPVVNHRTRRRAKDGPWIPVTVTKSAIHDERGDVVGHSLIIRDERARESLEEQMRRSERLSAISIMAGGIAHELNNPLSILGNRIELMQREAIRRDAGIPILEDLEVLRRHVGRIGSVTSDLIKFARDGSDELVAVDVNEVVGRVTRLLGKVFVESGVELAVEMGDDLPSVLGSEGVVETLLVNLLLNAQQATPSGGVVRVVTRQDPRERAVRMEVHDSGPGIPEELRRRIFEPFFTTKGDRGGTGLGLAVCRALVDRVGGNLELVTVDGRGASFVVTLPRKVEVEV